MRRRSHMQLATKKSKAPNRNGDFSASCNRGSQNIVIEAIIIFELTFCDVERHIFVADLVIAADNRPLNCGPSWRLPLMKEYPSIKPGNIAKYVSRGTT